MCKRGGSPAQELIQNQLLPRKRRSWSLPVVYTAVSENIMIKLKELIKISLHLSESIRFLDRSVHYTTTHHYNMKLSYQNYYIFQCLWYTHKKLCPPLLELDMRWKRSSCCFWSQNFSNAKLSKLSALALSRSSWY